MKHKIMMVFTLLFFMPFPSLAQEGGVTGLWLTQNERAAIQIVKCADGASICGKIAWIIEGGQKKDIKNENPELRDRPLCGMTILQGFEKGKASGEWVDGKIYKADDGDVYNATVTQVDDNRLRLRGYVGMPLFGKTQMWKRVDPVNYPACTAG